MNHMTPEIERHLRAVCSFSEFNRARHGALVLNKRNYPIGFGWNKRKTHPKQKYYSTKVGQPNREYLHAEIAALLDCITENEVAISLIVGRINKNNKFVNSKPCPVCMRAIQDAEIKYIYYTNDKGELIKEFVV